MACVPFVLKKVQKNRLNKQKENIFEDGKVQVGILWSHT